MRIEPVRKKIKLTVLSPVAVTTGDYYTDVDFTVKNRKFLFIGTKNLVNLLNKKGQTTKVYQLLNRVDVRSIQELRKLINSMATEDDAVYVLPADEDFVKKYSDNLVDFRRSLKTLNRLRVRKIYRNPLNISVYIPGSTLKGAIRTAIINSLITNKEELLRKIKEALERKISDAKKELEATLLCEPDSEKRKLFRAESSRSSRDFMRFIKVSDLREVESEVRVGVSYNFKPGEGEKVPVNLEYVNSGVFEGEIVIYPDYLKGIFPNCGIELSWESIINFLRKHYHRVFKIENEKFDLSMKVPRGYNKSKNVSIVKLGFHAGALSKTVADDSIRKVRAHPKKGGFKPQPGTTWVINGKPMGWALLEVLD